MTKNTKSSNSTQENKTSNKASKVSKDEVKEVKEEKEVKKRQPKAKAAAKEEVVVTESKESKEEVVTKKVKKTSKKAAAAEETPVVETSAATTVSSTDENQGKRELTREFLEKDFDTLLTQVQQEIENIKNGGDKKTSSKFLKQVCKSLKILKNNSLKLSKKKKKVDCSLGTKPVSGFMKPVSISKEMTAFAGWGKDELKSRVDVTKSICEYIKTNNLQNPKDKRNIIPDDNLKKILSYDNQTPLTYYTLQKLIQPHFLKTAVQAK